MFLCGSFLIKGQTARELFDSEAYIEAAVAFEYEYFRDPSDSTLLYKSYCYKALGDYENALAILTRIQGLDVRYEKALLHYLNEDYERSNTELLRLRLDGVEFDRNLVVLQVLVEISRLKYKEAREALKENAELLGLEIPDIDYIIDAKAKARDPLRAQNLSLWIPGTGQWYAGHFGKGLLSGSIQTGIVAFTGWSFYTGYFFSGTLTGATLFYTFYLGGARYAKKLAGKTNDEVTTKMKQRLFVKVK